jgi:hypothetical protein
MVSFNRNEDCWLLENRDGQKLITEMNIAIANGIMKYFVFMMNSLRGKRQWITSIIKVVTRAFKNKRECHYFKEKIKINLITKSALTEVRSAFRVCVACFARRFIARVSLVVADETGQAFIATRARRSDW